MKIYQVVVTGEAIAGFRITRYSKKVFYTAREAEEYTPDFVVYLKDPRPFDALAIVTSTSVVELDLQPKAEE